MGYSQRNNNGGAGTEGEEVVVGMHELDADEGMAKI